MDEKKLKQEIEEREDLVRQADALVENSDGSLNAEEQQKFDNLVAQIEEKDNYIAAKKRVEGIKAQQARERQMRNNNDGEASEIVRNFSMSEFLMSVHPGMQDELGDKISFYKDLNMQGKEEARRSNLELQGAGSKIIPSNVLAASRQPGQYRGDLTVGTEGADVVFTEDGGFIDQLNERLILSSVGADFMAGLTGDVKWPRESNAPTATWEGETDANAESTPTFDNVGLSPLRLGTYMDVSNQAILQTNPAIDRRLNRQLVSAVQRAIDAAGINGSGTGSEPEGVLNTSGIGDVAVGTNGGAQAWSQWVNLETEVAIDNADIGDLAYITNANVRGQAKQTIVDSGSGKYIWPVNATSVNGYPVGVSNLVPSDLTKGTGTALSALIFGNWNDLVIGQWGGLEVLVDPFTQATSGMTRMIINVYVDVAILRAVSFAACQDIDADA